MKKLDINLLKNFLANNLNSKKITVENGYLSTIQDNLIDGINVELFEKDFYQGQGNELQKKFLTIHSSSALVVNNFAFFKTLPKPFGFLDYGNFDNLLFEKKCSTGLGGIPPNFDVFFQNEENVIAVESKFTEILSKKEVIFSENYSSQKLRSLLGIMTPIIELYKKKKLYLDVVQLVKHSLGLLNKYSGKDKILLYVYWKPINYVNFTNYIEHDKELEMFSEDMKNTGITFISISYLELWDLLEKNELLSEHIKKVREKYFFSL